MDLWAAMFTYAVTLTFLYKSEIIAFSVVYLGINNELIRSGKLFFVPNSFYSRAK